MKKLTLFLFTTLAVQALYGANALGHSQHPDKGWVHFKPSKDQLLMLSKNLKNPAHHIVYNQQPFAITITYTYNNQRTAIRVESNGSVEIPLQVRTIQTTTETNPEPCRHFLKNPRVTWTKNEEGAWKKNVQVTWTVLKLSRVS